MHEPSRGSETAGNLYMSSTINAYTSEKLLRIIILFKGVLGIYQHHPSLVLLLQVCELFLEMAWVPNRALNEWMPKPRALWECPGKC